MTKKTDFQKRISQLEEQKSELIERRYNEIASLVKKLDVLSLDNNLIIGALCYAKSISDNEDKSKIEELEKFIPSRFLKIKKPTQK